ncbi:von Willebrand factor type A [Penicillium concentricum]|uniref:von Willebrand factor type A n=1 Tax=Penicillium concentricum TaxID=293559 RepID=A0A9W9V409_9EURO|nr:von Willebrand factor type A [Penicillium concentricum]KAJ5365710.1 von Willebrand factor type A [Penicillium concentricum]
MSIWHTFSSSHRQERKERKAGTATASRTTTPTHYPSWSRGRTHSSNTKFTREQSDLPPSYEEAQIPTIRISAPEELESDSQFAFLSQFHTIFLVDDSSSMRGALWQEAREAIAAIAPVCTKYDKEGIDIYFINHRSNARSNTNYSTNYGSNYTETPDLIKCPQFDGGYYNIRTAQRVSEIFASVRPFGGTGVGSRLRNILDPYMDLVEEKEEAKRTQKEAAKQKYFSSSERPKPIESVTPINIITITDGVFTDDAESIITQTAQRLDGPSCRAIPWQIGIQFFQIGNDQMAQQYLEELDEDLGRRCNNLHLRDIVDTVPWRNRAGERLEGDGILKAVLGAVHKRLDRKKIV